MTAATAALTALLSLASPARPPPLELPAPRTTGGLPLRDALARRATARAFDPARALTPQQLSDLLWAADGVNRPDGKRTAPSSHDKRELDVYVLLPQGVYRFVAEGHRLEPVLAEDLRAAATRQEFAKDAPLTLVYVADRARMDAAEQEATAAIDTGFVSQNVYLWCASEGLATGVRSWVDREALARRMGLRPEQLVMAAQSLGYPPGAKRDAPGGR